MRDSKGRFIKGIEKSKAWYDAMAKRTGENHSMYKPELHKIEVIECACGCGELFNKYDKKGRERRYKTHHFNKILGTIGCRKHTPETRKKISLKIKGRKLKEEGEYITPESTRERGKFRREMQKKVFERDDYTCQICGVRGVCLQVDHIQSWAHYPELRFKMDNCRTVCMDCHYYETFGRERPKGVVWGHNFSHAKVI
jgi:5-methylcytosine-specific restriction endonuclease McrA